MKNEGRSLKTNHHKEKRKITRIAGSPSAAGSFLNYEI